MFFPCTTCTSPEKVTGRPWFTLDCLWFVFQKLKKWFQNVYEDVYKQYFPWFCTNRFGLLFGWIQWVFRVEILVLKYENLLVHVLYKMCTSRFSSNRRIQAHGRERRAGMPRCGPIIARPGRPVKGVAPVRSLNFFLIGAVFD